MPNPVITPPANDSAPAAADVTQVVWFDIWLGDFGTEDEKELIITVAPGSKVRMVRDPTAYTASPGQQIFDGATWNTSTFILGNWEITPDDFGNLFIEGAGATDGYLQIAVIDATGAAQVTPNSATPRVDRVLAGPGFPGPATATDLNPTEGQAVQLTSAAPTLSVWTHGAPGGALPTLPSLKARWAEDGANATPAVSFVSAVWSGVGIPTADFEAPGVPASTPLTFHVTGWYDLDNAGSSPTAGEPALSQSVVVTVEPAQQIMVVVVDRSGSMTSKLPGDQITKWDAAVAASHAWGDLFHALRPTGDHKLGFVAFEHSGCGWGQQASAGDIELLNPATGSATASLGNLSGFDHTTIALGAPGSCTPIGDALDVALNTLKTTSTSGSPRFSVLLLTDGMENAGRVTITKSTQQGASKTLESLLASDYAGLAPLSLYTVGVGESVDEAALNDLKTLGASAGDYRLQLSVRDVLPAFADMLGSAAGAVRYNTVGGVGDANPQPNAVYFAIPAAEDRAAVLIPWDGNNNDLELNWRTQADQTQIFQGAPGAAIELEERATHGVVSIDLKQLAGDPAPAVYLRVRRLKDGVAVPLDDQSVICLVDPRTTAHVKMSKPVYAEGDPVEFHVRVRTGGLPVKGATVTVEVDRPSQSMGTFLSVNAGLFLKYRDEDPCKAAILTHAATSYGSYPDPATPHTNMLQTLLRMTGQTALPRPPVPSASVSVMICTGDYRGARPDTLVEGTYRFKVRASGVTPDGDRFEQVHGVATYVGFVASPIWTTLFATPYKEGRDCVTFTVTPRDANGGYLGPFKAHELKFNVAQGAITGGIEDHLDGSYSVVWCGSVGKDPGLVITIGGVRLTFGVAWGADGQIDASMAPWGAPSEKYRAYWDVDGHFGGLVLFPVGQDRFHWRTKDPDELKALVDLMRSEKPFYLNRELGIVTTDIEQVGPGDKDA